MVTVLLGPSLIVSHACFTESKYLLLRSFAPVAIIIYFTGSSQAMEEPAKEHL